jgi:flagellar hook assembly protein FlgD
MMDIDTSFVGDTLSIMFANAVFSDSLGGFLFDYQMNVSAVVIDDVTSVENENINPENKFISLAYPNPFNATVTVRYSLPEESDVEIVIYDIRGRAVKTIYKEGVSAGENSIIWDGTGKSGDKVSSGVYLYRITAEGYEATSRMTLLK